MPAPIACVDGGVDYLTCTYNSTVDFALLGLMVQRTRKQEEREGGIVRPWGMSGYHGEQVGGLEWGTREDGSIVRLSGFSAQRWWRRFGKLATNCSRIDYQETFVHDEPWSKTVGRHFREMLKWYKSGKRRPKPKCFVGPDGPESFYSGSRKSDTFLRCYHRGSKPGCENEVGHVRYEVEFKGDHSSLLLPRLLAEKDPHHHVRSHVFTQFDIRGCSLKWQGAAYAEIQRPTRRSDAERSLLWLERSVKPTVQNLLALGYEEEVFAALGCLIKD